MTAVPCSSSNHVDNCRTCSALFVAGLILLIGAGQHLRADLRRARAEPNLEKRSALALLNASETLKSIRAIYDRGEIEQVAAAVVEIEESVRLAADSLAATGKDPRRSPKWFKRAEIETRDLERKLEGLQQQMSFTDRHLIEKVKATVQRVHDELLRGLMEGKKK